MAYIIGKKVVKDTVKFNDYAYGIILPVRNGPTGYFEQAFTSFDQAKANLLNLLLTNKGERIMQPEFGIGLRELLFEQMTSEFETELEDAIIKNVGFWLPYINIKEIDVQMTDEMKDKHIANMNLKFTVGSELSTQEITFAIQG